MPGSSEVPNTSRRLPWWMQQDQWYAEAHVAASHVDALYRFGEYVMFVLLWAAEDYERGLVGKCPCIAGDRIAQAYDQPSPFECPMCFGTTFQGGWRAKIIRPAILTDRNTETSETRRGEVTQDAVSIETTNDFFARRGDYMFRADGNRYQLDQMETITVRSGMQMPTQGQTIGGMISGARMEDINSVAHKIPPDRHALQERLHLASLDPHLAEGVARHDQVRAPLVPHDI